MKKLLILLSAAFVQLSCEKEADYNASYTAGNKEIYSFIKIVNAYPYAQPSFSGQTSSAFRFIYNGELLTGVPTAVGSTFPAAPEYFLTVLSKTKRYLDVNLALGTAPAATRDSFLFRQTPIAVESQKHYSMFLCDSLKSNGRFLVVEDDIKVPQNDTSYRIRFVNLIPNPPGATPAIDVYTYASDSLIFSNVRFKGVTPFIELKRITASTTTNTFRIKWAGTNTVIGTALSVTTANKMSATLVAKGFVGATGLRAPGLIVYRNK